jgi:hypothetical protein
VTASTSDWSRSEREFQLRVDNCRRCIEGGVPNAAWCTCVLGLIADLGGQAAAARDLAVSVEAASQLDQRWMANRLFGRDDPEKYPNEVGMLGDLRNRIDGISTWIKRGAIAIIATCGTVAAFIVEQMLAIVFNWPRLF